MHKTIETHMHRQFEVRDSLVGAVDIEVKNVSNGAVIASHLINADAVELGEAVLKAAGKKTFTYEGTLPGVGVDGTYFVAGPYEPQTERKHKDTSSAHVMEQIKCLIAIHNRIVKEEEYRKTEEYKKAEALRVLNERRNALVNLWSDSVTRSYSSASQILKNAVDDHIKLQDKLAAKNNPPLAQWEIDLLEGK